MTARKATAAERGRQIFIESKGQFSTRKIWEQLRTEGFPDVAHNTVQKWRIRHKWTEDLSPAILDEVRRVNVITPRAVPEPDLKGLDGKTIDQVQQRILAMAFGISEIVQHNLKGLRPKRPSDFIVCAQAVTQLATAHIAVSKALTELEGMKGAGSTPDTTNDDGAGGDDRFSNVIEAFSGKRA